MARRRPSRLRFVRQTSVSDCGLACIAMVASAYGCNIALPELRKRFPPTLRGMTVRQVVNAAEAIGFDAQAVTVELDCLNELSLPAVLHWRWTHFVVLSKVTADGVVLLDPVWGRKRYKTADLKERLTGVAVEMRPTDRLIVGSIGRRQGAFRPIIDELQAIKGEFAKLLLIALYLESLLIAVPLLIGRALDVFAAGNGSVGVKLVWTLLLGTLAIWALRLYRSIGLAYLNARVKAGFFAKLVPRLLNKSFDFFRQRTVPELESSLAGAEPLRSTMTDEFGGVLVDGLMAVFILLVMAYLNPVVALVTLVAVGLIAASRLIMARKDAARFDDIIQSRGMETAFIHETLVAAKTIKLFGREHERAQLWRRRVNRTLAQEVQDSRSEIFWNTVPMAASELVIVGTIGAQVLLLPASSVSVGTIFIIYVYQRLIFDRCRVIAFRAAQLNILHLYLSRMTDVMEDTGSGEPGRLPGRWPRSGTVLEVDSVSFRFGNDAAPLLENVSFSIEAGAFLGIHGRSGVGKTTLLEILLGVRDANGGEVRWAGVPIKELDQKAFRNSVVAITQDDVLLAGTIEENITLFDERPDLDRMQDAARTAMLEGDILEMPFQYASLVGDGGCALSGGQRQRLLLARAFYARPRVLIIDEGTSQIDPATEAQIYAGLKPRGITLIVAAHRKETLRFAHRTLMLEGGRLFERELAG